METFLPLPIMAFLKYMIAFFVLAVGCLALMVVVLFLVDRLQTKHAIRHNYPVIGRLRNFFEHMGTFFRPYFFAMDREELPFNRAERSWVYRAAKQATMTVPFGSSRDISKPGTVYFSNAMYPPLEEEVTEAQPLVIGPQTRHPYTHAPFVNISAMSFGSISAPAVTALSKGAAQAGLWLNTGEGGMSDYHLLGGCDIVFQIGTARFGIRDESGNLSDEKLKSVAAHEQVKMFEIKLSQGAKPGKGGILPGIKVTAEIARIRGIPVGEPAISPSRFPEVDSMDDLLDMIGHVREVTGKPVGVKFCLGSATSLDNLCVAIKGRGAEQAPDFITIDSGAGGSGAAPMPLIDNVGTPIRESLPLAVDVLKRHGLRDRIRVIASGKLISPSEVAWALCAGADFVNSARGFMFALGCIQALQCNKNTCPTGITTHSKRLQAGLDPTDKATRVASYAARLQLEVEMIAHSCGVAEPRLLRREHARIVTDLGRSMGFDELYPEQDVPA